MTLSNPQHAHKRKTPVVRNEATTEQLRAIDDRIATAQDAIDKILARKNLSPSAKCELVRREIEALQAEGLA